MIPGKFIPGLIRIGAHFGRLAGTQNCKENTLISENLESSTDVVIERLSAAIEPVIIIFMAAVVGVIAYATILPILQISASVR